MAEDQWNFEVFLHCFSLKAIKCLESFNSYLFCRVISVDNILEIVSMLVLAFFLLISEFMHFVTEIGMESRVFEVMIFEIEYKLLL